MENKTPGITADEIVNKSKQWTLEGDCTLLRWMEQISKNLEERATKTTSDLSELSTKLERTSIALSNATNSLAALQYTQFVENRVHDDDETLANIEDVPNPSSDVVDKSTNDSSMYSFLKKNVEMMNSCHEAYAFSYDDSDEDEPATNVVYRSKNPYEARPLPHIYGTQQWKEKWHIGLCDSDTDFSGDENSEQFSESSSETDNSYESTAHTMSEWDSTAWGLNANSGMEQKQFRLPSNDGESYTQSEVSTPTEQRRDRLPIAQPTQDQRYYQHIPRKQDNLFDDIFDDSVQSTPQHVSAPAPAPVPAPHVHQDRIYHESLIPNEPPPDEEVTENEPNKRTGAKKTLNLFDDDEFSSFMNQIVETAKNVKSAPPPTEEVREPPKKVVPNLFEDHDDLFGGDSYEVFTEPKKVVQPRVEEKAYVPSSSPKAVAKTKIRNLFYDDDDDDDDFEKMFAAKKSGVDPFLKKTTNLFENDLDTESGATRIATGPTKAPLINEAKVREVPSMKKGLFDDEEDDIFEKPTSSSKKSTEDDIFERPTSSAKKSTEEGIFEKPITSAKKSSEDDIFEKPTSSTKKSIETRNLFNDEEKAESAEPLVAETPRDSSESGSGKLPEDSKKITDFADLFQDEPPEGLFPPTPSAEKTKVADIFADDFADDFEEFLPKTSADSIAKVEKPPPVTEPAPAPAAKVDFSDLFPDEPPEDIFPSLPVAKAQKMTELFADDFADEIDPPKPKISKSSLEDIPPNPSPRVKEETTLPADKEQMSSTGGLFEEILEKDKKSIDDAGTEAETLPTETGVQGKDNNPKVDLVPSSKESPAVPSSEDPHTVSKDPIVIVKEKPKPPVPSFSSLFPDEPPSDDELPTEPPTKEKDVAPFSSINLFADVPPDDDFQVAPPSETKRIHSIFYDDFNETIEATREMRAPSNYIFNDEPPPDDDVQTADDKPQPKVAEEKKDKPKVSKLKKFDLQINVNALLPTAKMPSFKKPEAVAQRVDSSPKTTPVTPAEAPSKEVREKRDLPKNILPNLNRDRVKLGVKRRPSTRKGRQESYRKSLIEEEAAIMPSDQESDAEVEKAVSAAKQPNLQDELFASRTFVSRIREPEKQQLTEPPSEISTTATTTSSSRGTSLFEDFGDFGGGKLFGNLSSSQDKPRSEPVSNDSPFHDNDAVVNPFGTPKTTLSSVEATPTLTQKTVSLFDDPPPDETVPPSPRVVQSSKVSSLFEDSDDGSDDLFKEPKSMKKPTHQKPVESKPKKEPVAKPAKPSSSLFSSSDGESESDDIFGKSKLKVAPKKIESTKTRQSSSLFADLSDDDEDDLFGTSKKKSSSVDKSKVKPSISQPTKATAPPPQPTQQQPTTASYNPLSDLLDD